MKRQRGSHSGPQIGLVEWFRPGEYERVETVLADVRALGLQDLRTGIAWSDWYASEGDGWYAWLLPRLAETFARFGQDELTSKLEAIGMPFAPIAKPWDLLDDPHLNASGGLLATQIDNKTIHVPALPIALDGERLGKRADPPKVGEHTRELLAGLGCSPEDIGSLRDRGIVALP